MKFFGKKFLILVFSFLIMITNALYAIEIDDLDNFLAPDRTEKALSLSDVQTYGDFEYVSDSSGVYITAYKGSASTVNIPSTINGKKVLMLYTECFSYCDTVKRVNIPASINSIYEDAFINCSNLEWIEVDSGNVTYASNNGILYDKNYQYLVTCPEGRTGSVSVIDGCIYICDYAFALCEKVTSVYVPASVQDIAQNTFWLTPALSNISISSSNQYYVMSDGILYDKTKTKIVKCLETRTTSVTIPSTVTEIGDYAFYDCKNIPGSLVIPSNVKTIGEYAFRNCSSLDGTLTLPNSLTSLGVGAFYECSNLKDIVWGSGLLEIPEYGFAYCKSLTSLNLPNNVETIGECAFFGCSSVESLTIGRNTKTINNWAFDWLTSLKGNLVIPDSVQTIGSAVFGESPNIDGYVVIGSGVLEIGPSVFYNSSNAKGIIFKGNAPTITNYTFLKPDVPYYHLADKYGFDSEYFKNKDVRIYSLNPVINFFVNGSLYKSVTLSSYAMSVGEFSNPDLENLNFLGWYYDESYTQEFNFTDTFMNDTNIYAKTEEKNILSFDNEEIKVEINETAKLSVNYTLEDGATYSDIVWKSQDESVALVDSDGNITCVKTGETTIQASYKNAVASIKITVWQDVDRINIVEEKITVEVGDESELECDYHLLGDATFDDIEWISSDDEIVSVANGKITAHSEGYATIAAMYGDIIDTIDITVLKKNILNITEESYILQQGKYIDIPYEYYFNDGATSSDIVWTSSNTNVARVSNGRVLANLDGQATITATYKNVSSSIQIQVVKPDTITFSTTLLTIENNVETYKLPYTWYSYKTTEEEIIWTTSNAEIATVDNGVITIKDIGNVTIGVVCGEARATLDIKIVKPNELNIVYDEKLLRYNPEEIFDLDIEYYFNDDATKDAITYSSSNEDVVLVENNRLVQKGIGEAIVTASYKNVSDEIKITILPQDNITFSRYGYILKPEESMMLDYSYYLYNSTLSDIIFTSTNEDVATVDEQGNVLAISKGETTIIASMGDVEGRVQIVVDNLNYLKGDMNFDGYVNSTDAAIVLDKFKNADTKTIDIIVGDISGDCYLNSTDAALILDIYKN